MQLFLCLLPRTYKNLIVWFCTQFSLQTVHQYWTMATVRRECLAMDVSWDTANTVWFKDTLAIISCIGYVLERPHCAFSVTTIILTSVSRDSLGKLECKFTFYFTLILHTHTKKCCWLHKHQKVLRTITRLK